MPRKDTRGSLQTLVYWLITFYSRGRRAKTEGVLQLLMTADRVGLWWACASALSATPRAAPLQGLRYSITADRLRYSMMLDRLRAA